MPRELTRAMVGRRAHGARLSHDERSSILEYFGIGPQLAACGYGRTLPGPAGRPVDSESHETKAAYVSFAFSQFAPASSDAEPAAAYRAMAEQPESKFIRTAEELRGPKGAGLRDYLAPFEPKAVAAALATVDFLDLKLGRRLRRRCFAGMRLTSLLESVESQKHTEVAQRVVGYFGVSPELMQSSSNRKPSKADDGGLACDTCHPHEQESCSCALHPAIADLLAP